MKTFFFILLSVLLFGFSTVKKDGGNKSFNYSIDYSIGSTISPLRGENYIKRNRDMITVHKYGESKYHYIDETKKIKEFKGFDIKKGMVYEAITGHRIYILELKEPVMVEGKSYDKVLEIHYLMGASSYYIR